MSNTKSYTVKDIYEYCIDKLLDYIDYKRFKALLIDYFKIVSDLLLNSSEELKMPHRLGTLSIVKYRPKSYTSKSLSVDFNETKKAGKTIYHLNDHSNGYKYRLYWLKDLTNNSSIYKYQAILVRANKRELARIIKNNINDFPEI